MDFALLLPTPRTKEYFGPCPKAQLSPGLVPQSALEAQQQLQAKPSPSGCFTGTQPRFAAQPAPLDSFTYLLQVGHGMRSTAREAGLGISGCAPPTHTHSHPAPQYELLELPNLGGGGGLVLCCGAKATAISWEGEHTLPNTQAHPPKHTCTSNSHSPSPRSLAWGGGGWGWRGGASPKVFGQNPSFLYPSGSGPAVALPVAGQKDCQSTAPATSGGLAWPG